MEGKFFFLLQQWSARKALTSWVSPDGYIIHQNDYLSCSGRWLINLWWANDQVAGAGGTRPLENVFGEAFKGGFWFEVWNCLFSYEFSSFRSVFFCFSCFCQIWRQASKLRGFWFRRYLGAHFQNADLSSGLFFWNSEWDTGIYEKFLINRVYVLNRVRTNRVSLLREKQRSERWIKQSPSLSSWMVRRCIRLTRWTPVCTVIKYRLFQAQQNPKKGLLRLIDACSPLSLPLPLFCSSASYCLFFFFFFFFFLVLSDLNQAVPNHLADESQTR